MMKPSLLLIITFLGIESIFGLAVDKNNSDSIFNSRYNCVYLSPSQELDCVCPNYRQNSSGPDQFFELGFLAQNFTDDKEIASVKLHSCETLLLSMNMRNFPRPFYRLRIEDVTNVTVKDIQLLPNDTIDIWFRNIGHTLEISGNISSSLCNECQEKSNVELNIHILDVLNVKIKDFMISTPEDIYKLQMRNLESLLIQDSYFNGLPKDSLEIFNSDQIKIFHSEFHNSTNSSILINKVSNITIQESLIDKEAVEILSNATDITWLCSMSPIMSSPSYNEDSSIACFSNRMNGETDEIGSVEAKGAIVLTIVSSIMLLIAVTILCIMNKSGRLDQYL